MTATPTAYRGIIPPVVTPLTTDGQLDVPSLERLVAFLLDAGVDGLFVLGSSGEVAYLTDEQRQLVVKVASSAAAGQVPVLAGAIDMTTNRVIATATAARDSGADAVVVTAPFYVRTHPAEVARHFRLVASAVAVPVFAYDVPVAVHTKLSLADLVPLATDGVIAGVKDSSGDDVGFRRLALALRDVPDISLFTGHEVCVDAALMMGADGAVPGLANVDPHGYVALAHAASAGDWDAARREQDRLTDLFGIVEAAPATRYSGSAAGLGAFKTALVARGVIATNTMSAPMEALGTAESMTIRGILDRLGLLDP